METKLQQRQPKDGKDKKILKGGVVGTLMSNYGLEKFFKKLEIKFLRANVGDRYVKEKMKKNKYNLGGKQGEIYNVGNGKEISVNLIADIIGGNKVSVPKRPGEPDRSIADITKIKTQLNWQSKISIKKGIELLLKNIDNWKDAPVWTPETIKEATKNWFKLLGKS